MKQPWGPVSSAWNGLLTASPAHPHCAARSALAPPPWTSTASTLRRTPPWSGEQPRAGLLQQCLPAHGALAALAALLFPPAPQSTALPLPPCCPAAAASSPCTCRSRLWRRRTRSCWACASGECGAHRCGSRPFLGCHALPWRLPPLCMTLHMAISVSRAPRLSNVPSPPHPPSSSQLRGAPQAALHRRGADGGRQVQQPVHLRPLPPRQGALVLRPTAQRRQWFGAAAGCGRRQQAAPDVGPPACSPCFPYCSPLPAIRRLT